MYIYSRQNIPLRNIFTSPFPYLHKEDCLQPLLFQGSTHHKEGRFLSTRLRTRFGQLLSRFSSFRFTVTRNVFHQRFENVSPRSQPVMAEERSQACFRDKRKTGDCSSVHKHAYTHARTHARAWRAFLRKTGAIYGQTENSSQYSTSGFFLFPPTLAFQRSLVGTEKPRYRQGNDDLCRPIEKWRIALSWMNILARYGGQCVYANFKRRFTFVKFIFSGKRNWHPWRKTL